MIRLLHSETQAIKILKALIAQVPTMFGGDDSYYLELVDAEEKRSNLQNKYLWGWVYKELSKALTAAGYSHNGEAYSQGLLHNLMGIRFRINGEIADKDGNVWPIYESTSTMSKKRFIEYIAQINHYHIETYQISIPDHRDSEYWNKVYSELNAGRKTSNS